MREVLLSVYLRCFDYNYPYAVLFRDNCRFRWLLYNKSLQVKTPSRLYLANDPLQPIPIPHRSSHLRATKLVLGRVDFSTEELVQRRKSGENYGTIPKIPSQKGREMRHLLSRSGRGKSEMSRYYSGSGLH